MHVHESWHAGHALQVNHRRGFIDRYEFANSNYFVVLHGNLLITQHFARDHVYHLFTSQHCGVPLPVGQCRTAQKKKAYPYLCHCLLLTNFKLRLFMPPQRRDLAAAGGFLR